MIVPVDSISPIKDNEQIIVYAIPTNNHIIIVQNAYYYFGQRTECIQQLNPLDDHGSSGSNTSIHEINIDQDEFEYPPNHCCTNSIFCIHKYFFICVLCFMFFITVILLYLMRT